MFNLRQHDDAYGKKHSEDDAHRSAGLDAANKGGNVQGLAKLIFTNYVWAFEITSALLISAAVGAMILAHVEKIGGKPAGQVAKMRERFQPGNYPGPKAGPGVYATSNSVATRCSRRHASH